MEKTEVKYLKRLRKETHSLTHTDTQMVVDHPEKLHRRDDI